MTEKAERRVPGDVLLTVDQLAELCAVSPRCISRAIRDGKLRVMQAPGTVGAKGRRIARSELFRWIAEQDGEATRRAAPASASRNDPRRAH
ncbi:MAG: helix-turn-helix domain-containing protein [Planctomycetes bacterium]|nr:helix-turn-helix domain-containing protein [Planctomycetota bacterium]